MKKLCIVLALLLGACGGGGDGSGGPVAGGGATGPAPNAFVASVQALMAASPDDADPVDIDTVAVTMPDDTEPLAVN